MIQANLKPYKAYRRDEGVDAYGQPSTAFTFLKTIEASVFLQTQTVISADIRYKDATHIGLTNDKTLSIGDKIISMEGTEYRILLVNNAGRMAQLTLKGV